MVEHPLVRECCGGDPRCDTLEHCATKAIPAGPLRELGAYLARTLDEDQWAHAERLLLAAALGVRVGAPSVPPKEAP